MNYYNPIGVVALPQGKGFNREAFLNHVRNSNMKAAVVLDDLGLCASLSIPYPIHRDFTFEPHPGATVDTALIAAHNAVSFIKSHLGFDKVYWYINNEQDPSLLRFNMYAFMMKEIAQQGLNIKCVFGNFGSGSVKCGQGADPNEWVTNAEHFLRTLGAYPQHLIGVHEYTAYTPWYVSDGGAYRMHTNWKTRPQKINWNLPQWHIGRNMQGIASACKILNIAPPRVVVTESLIDHMGDLKELPKELNGYKTYRNRWGIEFPEYSLGELYSEFLIWAWETVYATAPVTVEAVTTFCYGNTGNWSNYNVADDSEYLRNMEEYRYAPNEEPLPQPFPDTSEQYLATLTKLPGDFVNVRSGPTALSSIIYTLRKGEVITYAPNSITNGWVYVYREGIKGWVSLQNGAVGFTKVFVEDKPDAEEILMKLRGFSSKLSLAIDALTDLEDELREIIGD